MAGDEEAEKPYIHRNVKDAAESRQLFLLPAGPSEGLQIGVLYLQVTNSEYFIDISEQHLSPIK